MSRKTSVLVLLLMICIAAGTLAIFVRDMNTAVPPAQVEETPRSTSTEPLRIDQVATTTPTDVTPSTDVTNTSTFFLKEYKSTDGVTTVVVKEDAISSKDESALYSVSEIGFYGTSTAFENQIAWKVTNASGRVMAEGSAYVSSTDSGLPGPFEVNAILTHSFPAEGVASRGTLEVFEPSPKDGTPQHVVKIPIIFGIMDAG